MGQYGLGDCEAILLRGLRGNMPRGSRGNIV
jgi:hypothetical protein